MRSGIMPKRALIPLRISLLLIIIVLMIIIYARHHTIRMEEKPFEIASVNGHPVFMEDYEKAIKNTLLQEYIKTGKLLEKGTETYERLRLIALEQEISRVLLTEKALEHGIQATQEEINTRLSIMKSAFPSEQAFASVIEGQDLSIEDIKNNLKDEIIGDKLLEISLPDPIAPAEAEIESFYKDHPERFKRNETVTVRTILSRFRPGTTEEDSRSKLETVMKKIDAGESLEKLARMYSDDHSADRGGLVGPLVRGGTIPEFDQKVFNMKPGEISGIFKSSIGFHIVKLISKNPAGIIDFEQAKPRIRSYLIEMGKSEALRKYIQELRESAKVEISPDFNYPTVRSSKTESQENK